MANEDSRLESPIACPGPDCKCCNGEACETCGAGLRTNAPHCEHDVIERHGYRYFEVPHAE